MHIQDTTWSAAAGSEGGTGRAAPLRVDAQRNLEHVLRAAREVFGELGYGAPMEDVARRARVGVGTVYRRFPSKDVLVRRIAEEETARLTEQARTALGQENEAWSALARFLRTSVASGAGRLLPPQVLRVQGAPGGPVTAGGEPHTEHAPHEDEKQQAAAEPARVPQQRARFGAEPGEGGQRPGPGDHAGRDDVTGSGAAGGRTDRIEDQEGIRTLLDVVGQLVERARAAGELRADVSVADVLLVIATAAPSLPDAAQQAAASARLLDILLEGLRSRPSERPAARE
ncbi:TetR/AcrR family transcriptional regulator [Streptomyces sp. NBC_01477]|uniref:TetR/AcrR family transcriptional regulator n=1 Tax=Streptomyces sp. NBC_01477 TaxID=2976015 RepID=UPI002E35BAB7|nr:helix-turn-helix domain-containing protein [Streptomyces sp. NBC_01477]